MALLQRGSTGPINRNDRGALVRAGTSDACCCQPPPGVEWYAIFRCDQFDAIVDTTLCCDGVCSWITAVRFCELLQDAVDAGDIPSGCVNPPDADGLCQLVGFTRGDTSLCDINVPDFLVVWNNKTQSCYRLYLRNPFGVTFTACQTATTADYDHPPVGGTDVTNLVRYVGVDCCTAPCHCDGSGNPDPPLPPAAPFDNSGCGCDGNGSTIASAAVSVTECGCISLGGISYILTDLNQSLDITNSGAGCAYIGYYLAQLKLYSTGDCSGAFTKSRPIVAVSGTVSGAGWSATAGTSIIGGGGNIFSGGTTDGTCASGSPANGNVTCSAAVSAINGNIHLNQGGLP